MADKKEHVAPPPAKKGALMRNIMLLALLALAVLGGLAYLTFDPQSLTDIDGYRETPRLTPPAGRDLANVLDSAYKGAHQATITEEEINNYIQRTLKVEQEGAFAGYVELKRAWVRLEDGVVEIIIERELLGQRRHTVAMLLTFRQEEGEDGQVTTQVDFIAGRLGRIQTPEGYLKLVLNSFTALGKAYESEIDILKDMFKGMTRVTIEDGQIVLTPPDRAAIGP